MIPSFLVGNNSTKARRTREHSEKNLTATRDSVDGACIHGAGGGGVKVTPNLAWDWEGTRVLRRRRLDPAVADILITTARVDA